jgi:hypothetical protein
MSKFLNITTATTTVVSSKKCKLKAIKVNKAVLSGTITIYDNTSAAGTKIGTITNPASLLQSYFVHEFFGLDTNIGLTIVTSAAEDITVIYD